MGFLLSCSTAPPPQEPLPGKESNLPSSSKASGIEADKNLTHRPGEAPKKAEKANEEYAGAEICQTCHSPVYDLLAKTPMGKLFLKHPRTADEKLGCETCHGPGTEHVGSGGKSFAGMVRFTKGTPTPVSVQNDACLKCHQKRERLFWSGSAHYNQGLACTSCHVVHTGPGITKRAQLARLTVEDTCATCHKEQVRAENKFSHHPTREGKMDCASCHNPHGTASPKLVKAISTRELCFNCHAQYRGPFIFQHPPVMEDCFNCHQPHGSAYPSLLKTPPIRLCRECHVTFHNTNFLIAGPGPKTRPNMMAGSACVNCHRNIHGSNSMGPNANLFFR
ncbi:MAG: DmsE family decaheme c-type cytochrome [Desulfobaccales bacterium]